MFRWLGRPSIGKGILLSHGAVIGLCLCGGLLAMLLQAHAVFFICITASVVLAFYLTARFAHMVTARAGQLAKGMDTLAAGTLDVRVSIDSDDELGYLEQRFNHTCDCLEGTIREMDDALIMAARGDLTARPGKAGQGGLYALQRQIYNFIASVSYVLEQIRNAADLVADGSGQVSANAQALAQGVEEQAGEAENLIETIKQLAQQISLTAVNARESNKQSNKAGVSLLGADKKVRQMIVAMEEMTANSIEISKAMKAIEEIAFQTNILALNATLEAARAGSAGKGFAVVAQQVRELAERSAQAARKTSRMLENSSAAIVHGQEAADEVKKTMDDTMGYAKGAVEWMEHITAAAEQQAHAVQQLTEGVERIEEVVQSNSATAQESAATSEELFAQAESLRGLIKGFRLRDGAGAHALSHPGRLQGSM